MQRKKAMYVRKTWGVFPKKMLPCPEKQVAMGGAEKRVSQEWIPNIGHHFSGNKKGVHQDRP